MHERSNSGARKRNDQTLYQNQEVTQMRTTAPNFVQQLTPRDDEEQKHQHRENSDIKDVMTNASAEKQSLNSSFKTDQRSEHKIRASYSQPLDLISEYRSTILQRYAEKVLEEPTSEAAEDTPHQLNEVPVPSENDRRYVIEALYLQQPASIENSLPGSNLQSDKNIPSRKSRQQDFSRERKRHKSCRKTDNDNTLIDHETIRKYKNSRQRASMDRSISLSTHNQSQFLKTLGKAKASAKRQLESAAANLTIGELKKFYTIRRPGKEDLNAAHMLMILVYSNFESQLFKIGMSAPEEFSTITWKTAKNFLESHSKFVVTTLKAFP